MDSAILTLFERFGELKRVSALSEPRLSIASTLFLETTRLLSRISSEDQVCEIIDRMVIRGLLLSVIGDWRQYLIPPEFEPVKKDFYERLLKYIFSGAPSALGDYYTENAISLLQKYDTAYTTTYDESDKWLVMLCQTTRSGYAGLNVVKCIPVPTEKEAEHSLVCALITAVLCRLHNEPSELSCIVSLFHHLRCLAIPNCDHEADVILGQWSDDIREYTHHEIVRSFPDKLQKILHRSFSAYKEGHQGPARRYYEADILDRTLQLNYYSRMNRLQNREVMTDYDFFNGEPLKSFQLEVLKDFGLLE